MTGLTRTRGIGSITAFVIARSALELQMVNDLDECFFNNAEFAVNCTYTHYNLGTDETYKVIYDDPTQTVLEGTQTQVIALKPQIMIAISQMKQQPTMRDVITLNGIQYTIDEIENDGVGVLTLYLLRKTGSR